MLEEEIQIAYDRKNGKYVAYNDENDLFATGVCVETACDAYRSKYYERQAEMAREDHLNSVLA